MNGKRIYIKKEMEKLVRELDKEIDGIRARWVSLVYNYNKDSYQLVDKNKKEVKEINGELIDKWEENVVNLVKRIIEEKLKELKEKGVIEEYEDASYRDSREWGVNGWTDIYVVFTYKIYLNRKRKVGEIKGKYFEVWEEDSADGWKLILAWRVFMERIYHHSGNVEVAVLDEDLKREGLNPEEFEPW